MDTTGYAMTASSSSMLPHTIITASNSNLVLTANGTTTWTSTGEFVSLEMDEIRDRLSGIEDMLAILQPNIELHEKFPALRNAYEEYLMIKKLINGSETKNRS